MFKLCTHRHGDLKRIGKLAYSSYEILYWISQGMTWYRHPFILIACMHPTSCCFGVCIFCSVIAVSYPDLLVLFEGFY